MVTAETLKQISSDVIASHGGNLVQVSHQIHKFAELAWNEFDSTELVARTLSENGFSSVVGAYGIETAVEATFGEGDFTVTICAEYDALPGMGHACGHNVIAASAIGAAIGLSSIANEVGIRIQVLGTPAEEGGGGKVALLEAGAWNDSDISLMVHGMTAPSGELDFSYRARALKTTAVARYRVTFLGRSAHAANPSEGINAGNAALLAMTAISMLRQQLSADTRMNAVISNGGEAVNAVPGKTQIDVEMRAFDMNTWNDMRERVKRCVEGAAIATDCSWEWELISRPYAPMQHDEQLATIWDQNILSMGYKLSDQEHSGVSTDMGNVSNFVPSIHPLIAFEGVTVPPHNPEFAVAARSNAADRAIICGALAMASTVIDVACDKQLREKYRTSRQNRSTEAARVQFGI